MAISEAASLASHYVDQGWAVGLRTFGGGVDAGTGTSHLKAMLNHLARVVVHGAEHVGSLPVPSRSGGARLLVRHPLQRDVRVDGTHWDEVHEPARSVAA